MLTKMAMKFFLRKGGNVLLYLVHTFVSQNKAQLIFYTSKLE